MTQKNIFLIFIKYVCRIYTGGNMLNGVNNVGYNSYELRNKQSFQKRVDNPIETEAKKEEGR